MSWPPKSAAPQPLCPGLHPPPPCPPYIFCLYPYINTCPSTVYSSTAVTSPASMASTFTASIFTTYTSTASSFTASTPWPY